MSKIYIKIKSDCKKSRPNPENTFLELLDNATFREVKEQLEDHVAIAPDEQIIKTVSKTFYDHDKLSDLERNEGSTVMLYDSDSRFICFLQIYNEEEAALQRQYEQRSKRPSFYKNLSTTSSVTLVAESEKEESSDSSKSPDNSSDSEDSKDSEDNLNISFAKKRKMEEKDESQLNGKRYSPLFNGQISEYLDELPTYTDTDGTVDTGISSSTPPPNKSSTPSTEAVDIQSKISNFSQVTETPKKSTVVATSSNVHTTNSETERKPCHHIAPEYRQFIAIAKTHSKFKDFEKCQIFLEDCFDKFQQAKARRLVFDDKIPITLHSDGIWISCKDDQTLSWILEHINCLTNVNCSIEKFFNPTKFEACSVVIPGFQKNSTKSLQDIFNLMEIQNQGLDTSEWIVMKQRTITGKDDEFFERKVSCICANEIIFFHVNKESETFLKENNFQLKYCFWKLLVSFENETGI